MAKHRRAGAFPKPKGSTIIITVMFLSVVAYVWLTIWFYSEYYAFLPPEVTLLIGACFVAETVSLAKYKMRKESADASRTQFEPPVQASNPFLQTLGLGALDDFESEGREVQ